jgi:hypothetical protein
MQSAFNATEIEDEPGIVAITVFGFSLADTGSVKATIARAVVSTKPAACALFLVLSM